MPDTFFWHTAEILAATDGVLLKGDPEAFFRNIVTDSRKAAQGELFVALRGTVHDGHHFISQALHAGCAGILMDKDRWPEMSACLQSSQATVVAVTSTLEALGALGRHRLKRTGAKVLAVTGSNGKTSTKEMLGCIFRKTCPCLITEGNFNNEIGLPLTLFRLNPEDHWAILELGMNHPGEMTRLSAICQPDMALITRIAPAHLEGLGSVEGVARAKGEIFNGMKAGGVALINGSDPDSRHIPIPEHLKVLRFGREATCDFRMEGLVSDTEGSRFDLCRSTHPPLTIRLSIPGAMMAENALAAASAALTAGIPEALIQEGLLEFRGFPGRFQVLKAPWGGTLINDTYNANPDSMAVALMQLARLGAAGRRFAVLGSMGELGGGSARLHRETGRLAAETGLFALYACGPHGPDLVEGARGAGLRNTVHAEKEHLAPMLLSGLAPGDWVLVKGSRSMTMETLVHQLMQDTPSSSRN